MWQFLIPAIASGIGALAGGRSKGKQEAAQTTLSRDAMATQQYQTQQQAILQALLAAEAGNMNRANLDLNRREFQLSAPNQRGATAVRGDLMSRAKDVRLPGNERIKIQHIEGGARPSMLSPETRQLGQSMTRNALMGQLKGDEFANVPLQNFGGAVMKPPGQGALPESNWLDKVLGVAAPIAAIGGAIGTGMQDKQNQDWLDKILEQQTAAGQMSRVPGPWATPPFNPNIQWMGGQ